MSYLLNLQLLQREKERRETWEKNCYGLLTGWLVRSLADRAAARYLAKVHKRATCWCWNRLWDMDAVTTCLTWRTLQSQVFVLHFNQHFNMPWSGGGKKKKQLMRAGSKKRQINGKGGREEEEGEEHLLIVTDVVWMTCWLGHTRWLSAKQTCPRRNNVGLSFGLLGGKNFFYIYMCKSDHFI